MILKIVIWNILNHVSFVHSFAPKNDSRRFYLHEIKKKRNFSVRLIKSAKCNLNARRIFFVFTIHTFAQRFLFSFLLVSKIAGYGFHFRFIRQSTVQILEFSLAELALHKLRFGFSFQYFSFLNTKKKMKNKTKRKITKTDNKLTNESSARNKCAVKMF